VYSRSHHAVIRVYDAAGNVIETHEHAVLALHRATIKSRYNRAYRVDGLSRAQRAPRHSVRRIGCHCAHALPFSDFGTERFVISFLLDDPRWIKWLAIAIVVLTAALVFLTIVLARYASRLDALTDSLVVLQRSSQPSSPTGFLEIISDNLPVLHQR